MEASNQEQSEIGNGNEISKQDIQAAIAKAAELRALHAALMQGNSTTNLRFPSASPVSRHASHLSAQDYPVFTPSYEDEPLPGYQQILLENRNYAESWGEYPLNGGNVDETDISDYRTTDASSIKGFPFEFMNSDGHICPAEDQSSVFQGSPGPDNYTKSRRNSLGDFKSVSSCNNCKTALISSDSDGGVSKNVKKSNTVVPLTDSQSSVHSQPRNKGLKFSWLFPRLKKKNRNENLPIQPQPVEVSQSLNDDLGIASVETLKKELAEANESRDAALIEVSEMKSSLGELSQKLEYLETYCEELKRTLRQAVHVKNSLSNTSLSRREKSVDGNVENSMPVSNEVMVEGFLQTVSETRLSVKQFCKILIGQIEESDHTLVDKFNMLLQPYNLSLNQKHSKAVLYHLESIVNQTLYQDFENRVFQKNGTPKFLDLQLDRQAKLRSFVALRNLRWNEVLRKGTKYYSDEFSRFCDQKMSGIVSSLGWTKPWPQQLLQAFFVAAKCIWLLHLLAFSFNPAFNILRVDENRRFEARYMEDIFADKQKSQGCSRVKIMVMPGFYVHDSVVRCKVLCRYKSVA